jgi:hypothetical protein
MLEDEDLAFDHGYVFQVEEEMGKHRFSGG